MVNESVMVRAKAGDPAAMEALLHELAPTVHRFSRRLCRSDHEADDALQDALLAIATHLPEFEGRSSLSSWVYTLVRSACSHRRRGMKNAPPVADDEGVERVEESPSPEEQSSRRELSEALSDALDALPEEVREVLLLRDVEGLTAPEAAEAVGISVGALKSRLHRARAALREALIPVLEPERIVPQVTCPDAVALWSQKLEGDLAQADCAAMQAHLEACPACSGVCDALRSVLLACQRMPDAPVPPSVQARVKSVLRQLTGHSKAPVPVT